MAFVPANEVALIELRYLWDSQQVENTLFFKASDPIDVALLTALCATLATWWGANMQPLISQDVSLVEIFGTDLTTATGPTVSYNTGLPLGGTTMAEAVPANVAPCISFRTNNRGRSFRGRNYLVGLPNLLIAGNHLGAGYMADVIDAYEAINPAVSGEGWAHVVCSKFSGYTIVAGRKVPTPRAAAVVTPVVTYAFKDDVADSQRGRLPNH